MDVDGRWSLPPLIRWPLAFQQVLAGEGMHCHKYCCTSLQQLHHSLHAESGVGGA